MSALYALSKKSDLADKSATIALAIVLLLSVAQAGRCDESQIPKKVSPDVTSLTKAKANILRRVRPGPDHDQRFKAFEAQFAAYEAANDRHDNASIFFVGSAIVEQAWEDLRDGILKTPDLDSEDDKNHDKKGFRPEILALERILTALEKLSVGPFVFDRAREESMIVSVRDRMAFTKLEIRSLLKEDKWDEAKESLEVERNVENLYSEVWKLRRDVETLKRQVANLTPRDPTDASLYPKCEEGTCCGTLGTTQSGAAALVTVSVPEDAQIWVDGAKTTSVGTVRIFSTPTLKTGHRYTYELRAVWSQDGHQVNQTKRVAVTAGARAAVTFQ
jgi:uncharacterized protein (TIGR03000 family)